MRIAPEWREQSSRYMGPGRALVEVEVTDQSLLVKNQLRRREFGVNHGGETWKEDFKVAMQEWGYTEEVTDKVWEEIEICIQSTKN